MFDRLQTVDKARLVRRLGEIDPETGRMVLAVLAEMFADSAHVAGDTTRDEDRRVWNQGFSRFGAQCK